MRAFKFLQVFILLGILLTYGCKPTEKTTVITIPAEGEFFDFISEYGFFNINEKGLIPHPSLHKYEVTNALFTDYALKDRFIYTPGSKALSLNGDGRFGYPTGTVMIKNFYYDEAQAGSMNMVETRILIKDESEWRAISYIWNEDKTDAKISKVGADFPMEIEHPERGKLSFDYVVPNKNQCKSCHNYDEKIDPLGFKYANLNRNISVDNAEVNQIAYFVSQGLINLDETKIDSMEVMIPYEDESAAIQDRALAYLDVNCGHCHRPSGPGNTSGLFLQFDETRTNHLGFCKGPVAAGKGSGGKKFDIYPGRADSSILVHRMASLDPGVMMPEVGRSLAHSEGIALVEEWINSLNIDCYAN